MLKQYEMIRPRIIVPQGISSVLPVFVQNRGDRVWRNDLYGLHWEPDADEAKNGPNTDFADGIYLVTVHEGTPTSWLREAMKATIASSGQHPGPDLLPGDNYDSAIAIQGGRIAGGALLNIEAAARCRWTVSLRPDDSAFTYEELTGPGQEECGMSFDRTLGLKPAVFTIWVHPAHRSKGTGGQLIRALANSCGLALDHLAFRLPLSREAVRMVQALGLTTVIGCF